ncbi:MULTISPECIES: ABC transporter permease [Haloarcula]|uniref:Sugar ABC transporter permease n=1 Tax=Haloarcula pellucida TaxID=1427151 RepID=A0A830GHI8_9EURY|nr:MULTISPECIES: ABC transporter permease [Halomicroarcula]MBX0347394.1 ABC transporter permease [Halomicroarcula pellucida]MDS0276731.1 ABC transporter permease [Halomicroarcula sp. S1AR25-4]GGN88443.1 sugar ABC transporter permease [Halomicroarcula pellucida]
MSIRDRDWADVLDRTSGESTKWLLWGLDNMIWPIVIVTFAVFAVLMPEVFTSASNIQFMLYSSAGLGALVLAESLCLLSGNFDLSIGSIAGFSAMVTALFLNTWFPSTPGLVGVVLVLAIGGAIGFVNGVSIGYFGINPFLQTLAFFIIFRGAVFLLSTITVAPLPESYLFIGGALVGDLPLIGEAGSIWLIDSIPIAVLLIVGLYAATWFVMNYRRIGLAIMAVGGDENAAEEAGIPRERVLLIVFTTSGVLSGLAGLLYTGYLSAAPPGLAEGDLFPAFAGAVIGGISLTGGRGDIENAFGGMFLLTMIQVGLVQVGVGGDAIQFINGLVLLLAIYLYTTEAKIRHRLLST